MSANAPTARVRWRLPHICMVLLALALTATVVPPAPASAAPAHAKAKAKAAKQQRNAAERKRAKQLKAAKRRTKRRLKAAQTPVEPQRFGINGGGLFQKPVEQWAPVLQQFRAAGMSYVRADLSWGGVEPKAQGGFDFSRTDHTAEALARAGLRWYPVLAYSTAWSGVTPGDYMSRPADPARYAAYVAAVAARYGAGGSFWREHPDVPAQPFTHYEIWNEQNARRFWREQETAPEDYADLYAAARGAVRSVDPNADVVVGGLVAMGAIPFLTRFYAHRPDLRGNVDGVGYHLYNQTASDQLQSTADFRRTLERLDPGVPLEITEAGFSLSEMAEPIRASQFTKLVQGIDDNRRLNVRSLIPFSAMSGQPQPGNWESMLGLWNLDGSPKPAAAAYMAAVKSAVS